MYISNKNTVLHCETLRTRINLQQKLLFVICLLLFTTKLKITVTNEFKRIVYLKKMELKSRFFYSRNNHSLKNYERLIRNNGGQ